MDSLIKPPDLFARAKELGQSAIGVTDHGTLAGAWDCLKASKETGVKLIMGCEFNFVDDLTNPNPRSRHVILLAKNHIGYKNLLLLNKLANENNTILFKKVHPRLDWNLLKAHKEGLICTTACSGGILGQLICNRKLDQAKEQAQRLKNIFGEDLYLEIHPNAMVRQANAYIDYLDQPLVNNQLIKIGKELGIKIIPATNAHFIHKEEQDPHDVLLADAVGQPIRSNNRLKYTEDFYMKSRDQVRQFFARLYAKDIDTWLDNTLELSAKCEFPEWIDPKFSNPSGKELPDFPVKDQPDYQEFLEVKKNNLEWKDLKEDQAYMRFVCEKNFSKFPAGKEEEYKKRYYEELDVLEYHGFSSYMLIVADMLDYARKEKILVGPGRGSVGASLVAYLINIHKADPIKYDLIFARFHNKEKKAYPDCDCDFSSIGRDQVQQYLAHKYGKDMVVHVSNVNTLTPKVFARDIARIFQYGGDRKAAVAIGTFLADLIPDDVHSMDELFQKAPLFDEIANKKYPELKKYASFLGAKAKAWSTHAGGVIIGKRPLHEIVPIRIDKDNAVALEYEKERAEANGLVKMDTLSISTLDIISETYNLINSIHNLKLDPTTFDYELDDPATYELIASGNTLGVFQFGTSGGTIQLCKQVKPKNLWDLALINALARPSAKDLRDPFIAVRNGEKKMHLIHPSMERAFTRTFGLFEECLMFLAKDVAGWDLHYADRLRKLTKEKGKNPKKVAAWKEEFIADAAKHLKVDSKIPTKIWEEVIDKFQGYGFNMPHALTYSMISFHTAWLKTHYPLEFLTANLIAESNSNQKSSKREILKIKDEIRKLQVRIIPPDINTSEITYKITDGKITDDIKYRAPRDGDAREVLMTGFESLKFMGKDAIPEILSKRPFTSLQDFLSKVDGRKVRLPAVLALIASGCLDSFGMPRKQMFLYAGDYKKKLQLWVKKGNTEQFPYPWPEEKEWSEAEKCAMEIFYLGEGMTGKSIETYPDFFTAKFVDFSKLPSWFPADLKDKESYIVDPCYGLLQGIIRDLFEFKVKKQESKNFGRSMAKMVIEDPIGNKIPLTCFPDSWENFKSKARRFLGAKSILEPGLAVHFAARADWNEGELGLIFDDLKKIAPAPNLPKDLKQRTISFRIPGAKKSKKSLPDQDEILDDIDDLLIQQGLAELEDQEDLLGEEHAVGMPDPFIG